MNNQEQDLWWVVYTRAKQEERAQENLQRQGAEVICPTIRVRKKRKDRIVTVIEPMFPRYLFVRLPNGLAWTTVRSTRGVVDFVRFGGIPAQVQQGLVMALAERSEDRTLSERYSRLPKSGDKVRMQVGQFAGIEAIVAETDGESRCLLLIELLGRQWKVPAAINDVEPLA